MTESREPVDKLQQLVLSRLAELGEGGRPMSPRRAAEHARGLVGFQTIYDIARGTHKGKISDRTAEGLAEALQVPVGRVYDAAGAPRPLGRWQPPAYFDRLDADQRRLVESFASALLGAYTRGYEHGLREASQ